MIYICEPFNHSRFSPDQLKLMLPSEFCKSDTLLGNAKISNALCQDTAFPLTIPLLEEMLLKTISQTNRQTATTK